MVSCERPARGRQSIRIGLRTRVRPGTSRPWTTPEPSWTSRANSTPTIRHGASAPGGPSEACMARSSIGAIVSRRMARSQSRDVRLDTLWPPADSATITGEVVPVPPGGRPPPAPPFGVHTMKTSRLLRVSALTLLTGLSLITTTVGAGPAADLAGTWRFRIDRDDRGLADEWWKRPLTGFDTIKLPGMMQAGVRRRGLGRHALDRPDRRPVVVHRARVREVPRAGQRQGAVLAPAGEALRRRRVVPARGRNPGGLAGPPAGPHPRAAPHRDPSLARRPADRQAGQPVDAA